MLGWITQARAINHSMCTNTRFTPGVGRLPLRAHCFGERSLIRGQTSLLVPIPKPNASNVCLVAPQSNCKRTDRPRDLAKEFLCPMKELSRRLQSGPPTGGGPQKGMR